MSTNWQLFAGIRFECLILQWFIINAANWDCFLDIIKSSEQQTIFIFLFSLIVYKKYFSRPRLINISVDYNTSCQKDVESGEVIMNTSWHPWDWPWVLETFGGSLTFVMKMVEEHFWFLMLFVCSYVDFHCTLWRWFLASMLAPVVLKYLPDFLQHSKVLGMECCPFPPWWPSTTPSSWPGPSTTCSRSDTQTRLSSNIDVKSGVEE